MRRKGVGGRHLAGYDEGRDKAAGRGGSEPMMSTTGAVTLGELVGRLYHLDVACRRCERRGRLRMTQLIADHGAATGLPDLAVRLAIDCPKARAPDLSERCFVCFPQLLGLS